jgi:hypothetical protein
MRVSEREATMTEIEKKPVAKVKTAKRTPPKPWGYAQQKSFIEAAKKFVRAQQMTDQEAMDTMAYRLQEDIKLGRGK